MRMLRVERLINVIKINTCCQLESLKKKKWNIKKELVNVANKYKRTKTKTIIGIVTSTQNESNKILHKTTNVIESKVLSKSIAKAIYIEYRYFNLPATLAATCCCCWCCCCGLLLLLLATAATVVWYVAVVAVVACPFASQSISFCSW